MSAPDISVVVFAGTSQPELHASLLAAERAIAALREKNGSAELLVVLNNASPAVLELAQEKGRSGVGLLYAGERDLGAARQLAVAAVNGRYVSMQEAGDMFSANWLTEAWLVARKEGQKTSVWRPEVIVGCGQDFFLDEGLYARLQTPAICNETSARLLLEDLYAPAFLARRELLLKTPFPIADTRRGWGDVDAWWTANAVGNGHPQSIVNETFLYRWNRGEPGLRQTRIGPGGLSLDTLATHERRG
ncbi:glycosyltransferase family 2 protein [Aureimonas fodinaquatilis]|uniref:Glycosyltransferase family 2 protein n=1 Tax=Aureimonas fodinaquatilis TaxID=2565783 RepID=A0A5B0DYP8_9HYPH|nr:glycosyltransferase family A protein [Aureimonas fodinaquatilis]KAA0971633.1 glycosyltransferase family 2 protein [Aureimonas fodinaquatilis]